MEALALDPEDAASWELLGELRSRDEQWVASLTAYDRATNLEGATERAWLGKGRALRMLGRLDAAQEALGRARTLAPDDATVTAEAGTLAEARGNLQQAIDLYGEAARAADGQQRADLQARLAAVHERRGDREAAAEALANAARADPGDGARWGRAAVAFEREGAHANAAWARERQAAAQRQPGQNWRAP